MKSKEILIASQSGEKKNLEPWELRLERMEALYERILQEQARRIQEQIRAEKAWQERMQQYEERRKQEEERHRQEELKRQKQTEERFQEEFAILRKETEAATKAREKTMDKFMGLFTSQWSRMIEELVKPVSVKLFKNVGIDIDHVFEGGSHRRDNGQEIEVDAILVNTTAVVAIEVKTTLRKDDVDHFVKQMAIFQDMFREFRGKTVYAAMAAMHFNEYSDVYAKRKGLFILRANSDYAFKLDDLPEVKRKTF